MKLDRFSVLFFGFVALSFASIATENESGTQFGQRIISLATQFVALDGFLNFLLRSNPYLVVELVSRMNSDQVPVDPETVVCEPETVIQYIVHAVRMQKCLPFSTQFCMEKLISEGTWSHQELKRDLTEKTAETKEIIENLAKSLL